MSKSPCTRSSGEDHPDIFISYSRHDRDTALAFRNLLRRRGWNVWLDDEVRVGTAFDREIERKIRRTKCVLVLWSMESSNSDWVRAEATVGFESGCLVSVKIEPDVVLPLRFINVQTSDYSNWDRTDEAPEFIELMSVIEETIGRPTPVPHELPYLIRDSSPLNLAEALARFPFLLKIESVGKPFDYQRLTNAYDSGSFGPEHGVGNTTLQTIALEARGWDDLPTDMPLTHVDREASPNHWIRYRLYSVDDSNRVEELEFRGGACIVDPVAYSSYQDYPPDVDDKGELLGSVANRANRSSVVHFVVHRLANDEAGNVCSVYSKVGDLDGQRGE